MMLNDTPLETFLEHHPEYRAIKESTLKALVRYVVQGIPPGGAMQAVLQNDLLLAVGRADDENQRTLPLLVNLIYNFCPSRCHNLGGGRGTDVVQKWCEAKEAEAALEAELAK